MLLLSPFSAQLLMSVFHGVNCVMNYYKYHSIIVVCKWCSEWTHLFWQTFSPSRSV